MNDPRMGELIAPNTIRFQRILPGPIERVWSYLTDPEKRSKWLASGPMEERLGGALRLVWLHRDLDVQPDPIPEQYKALENGHTMDSQITRYDPPHVLGFQWGKRADALSEVIIELSERGKDVLMVLTHAGLPNKKDLLGVAGGWHTHLDVLVEHLNGRTAPGYWGAHTTANAAYQRALGPDEKA
ncbi:MAG TPA: SRPBCC family protein [Flavobacteriales bacterium]|jgi:uncharacterized protein YndB with AHSA1/START domain|nr:SRPBCC family protein [Flavobacteriales bacterium]